MQDFEPKQIGKNSNFGILRKKMEPTISDIYRILSVPNVDTAIKTVPNCPASFRFRIDAGMLCHVYRGDSSYEL